MSRRPVPQAVASARGEEVLYERFAYQWYPTPIMRTFPPRPLQRCTCDYCTGKPPVPRFGFSNEYSEALSAEAPGGQRQMYMTATEVGYWEPRDMKREQEYRSALLLGLLANETPAEDGVHYSRAQLDAATERAAALPAPSFSNAYSEALSADAPVGYLRSLLRATCASCEATGLVNGQPCPDCAWTRT